MTYLIKLIFFLILSFNINANEDTKNKIIFKLNNKFFTDVDLENRTKYIGSINNLNSSEFSVFETNEILEDFISVIIFYEYYIQNKLFYKNLNDEIELVYKEKFNDVKNIKEEEIKNFKLNTKIDLIRKKIIEREININKNLLLKESNKLDLLYNYNLRNIIFKKNLIDSELLKNIVNRSDFNNLLKLLEKENIDFYYKEEDIDDNKIISKKIREIITKNLLIDININNEFVNLISLEKNLESYDGIFVKLINFTTNMPFKKEDLLCKNLSRNINTNKTIYKEYEYSKLNNVIKSNLKSINDYILINENNEYNYIILCDLTYDKELLTNLNFNKKINRLVKKIEKNFLKKYKNEYKFIKFK